MKVIFWKLFDGCYDLRIIEMKLVRRIIFKSLKNRCFIIIMVWNLGGFNWYVDDVEIFWAQLTIYIYIYIYIYNVIKSIKAYESQDALFTDLKEIFNLFFASLFLIYFAFFVGVTNCIPHSYLIHFLFAKKT